MSSCQPAPDNGTVLIVLYNEIEIIVYDCMLCAAKALCP